MSGTPLDELKRLSHSDTQRFANYLGSRLRTIGKVYYTRDFGSPAEKMTLYNNWGQELIQSVSLLGILQCTGKPLAIPKYIQASLGMDHEGTSQQLSEEWGVEDGLTTLLTENGGDWWDVDRRNERPIFSVGHLVWRWSIFECPESRSLSAIEDLSPGETEEHIRDMTEIRDSWAQLVDRQRSHLKALERHIEGVRAQLFRAERKELAGLKKF